MSKQIRFCFELARSLKPTYDSNFPKEFNEAEHCGEDHGTVQANNNLQLRRENETKEQTRDQNKWRGLNI
jgi:hypothetical protein